MGLFESGDFTLHSGVRSDFKIDCDALTDGDLHTLAYLIRRRAPPFTKVHGIPTGGTRLAEILRAHVDSRAATVLIVDDVYTTGRSMEEARSLYPSGGPGQAWGAVIFARGPCPSWVVPLFTMTPERT